MKYIQPYIAAAAFVLLSGCGQQPAAEKENGTEDRGEPGTTE